MKKKVYKIPVLNHIEIESILLRALAIENFWLDANDDDDDEYLAMYRAAVKKFGRTDESK